MTATEKALTEADCERPCETLLRLGSDPGFEAFLSGEVRTAPGPKGPLLAFPPRVSALNRGSLLPYIDGELFISASVRDPARVPQFAALHMLGAFLVGPEVKAFVETFTCPQSEFIPVSIDLSKRDWDERRGTDKIGGGEIIRGQYHIWNIFHRLDLIDPVRSTDNRAEGPLLRHDLPGSPEQRITFYSSLGPLVLTSSPFEQADVFQLLGFGGVFASPRFAEAVREAGFLGSITEDPTKRILFDPFPLELARWDQCSANFGRRPPLKIYGTDIVVSDQFGLPFRHSYS